MSMHHDKSSKTNLDLNPTAPEEPKNILFKKLNWNWGILGWWNRSLWNFGKEGK